MVVTNFGHALKEAEEAFAKFASFTPRLGTAAPPKPAASMPLARPVE
jgi:hypothetical protein